MVPVTLTVLLITHIHNKNRKICQCYWQVFEFMLKVYVGVWSRAMSQRHLPHVQVSIFPPCWLPSSLSDTPVNCKKNIFSMVFININGNIQYQKWPVFIGGILNISINDTSDIRYIVYNTNTYIVLKYMFKVCSHNRHKTYCKTCQMKQLGLSKV